MADQQGTTRHVANASNWRAVCTMPDYCKVGNAIVGFDSFAILNRNTSASPNVKGQGVPLYRVGDYFQQIQADAGQHIVSGTALGSGYVKLLDGQQNVKVNGIPVARHDSLCLINCDASGNGGTPGKIVTESKTVASKPVLKQIKEESGNVLSKKWESLKDSAKTLWDAFGTDPAGSAARQKIFNGVVDTMHGLNTLAGPDPYAVQGAYLSGDPESIAMIEQQQRNQQQAVNSISDHIKQSWTQAYARNGLAGASAMVAISLGVEIAGSKGMGIAGSIAGEITEIVRIAKTPLEAAARLDKEIAAAKSAGKSAEEIGLLQKARDERLAQAAKEAHKAEEAAKPAEGVHVKASASPIDIDHAIGADYTKAGKPTGGHSLLNEDVKIVPGTESVPDATGVYKATIQVPDPQNPGQWITKTSNNSMNSMFPKDWDAARIKSEVDSAWNSANKIVNGNKWSSFTPSGVKVEGFISPRTTVYPVYQP